MKELVRKELVRPEQIDKAIKLFKKAFNAKGKKHDDAWSVAYDFATGLCKGTYEQQYIFDTINYGVKLGLSNSQIKAILTIAGVM